MFQIHIEDFVNTQLHAKPESVEENGYLVLWDANRSPYPN